MCIPPTLICPQQHINAATVCFDLVSRYPLPLQAFAGTFSMDFENTFASLFRQSPSEAENNAGLRRQLARPSPGSRFVPSMIFEESPLKKVQIEEEEAQLLRDLKRTQTTMYDVMCKEQVGQGAALLPTIHVHGPAVFNVGCSSSLGTQAIRDMIGSCTQTTILAPPPRWANGSNGRYHHRYRTIAGSPRNGCTTGTCIIQEVGSGRDRENEGGQMETNQLEKCPSWLLPKLHALLPQTEGYSVIYLDTLPWAVRERVKSWMHMEKRQARLKELLESEIVRKELRSTARSEFTHPRMTSHFY